MYRERERERDHTYIRIIHNYTYLSARVTSLSAPCVQARACLSFIVVFIICLSTFLLEARALSAYLSSPRVHMCMCTQYHVIVCKTAYSKREEREREREGGVNLQVRNIYTVAHAVTHNAVIRHGMACRGWHYLSNATCITQASFVVCMFFFTSRITITVHIIRRF